MENNQMNRIKEVLSEEGIKQTWLAEKLGKSFKIVNNYACNRSQPSLQTLHKIAEILQVDVKVLIKSNSKNTKFITKKSHKLWLTMDEEDYSWSQELRD